MIADHLWSKYRYSVTLSITEAVFCSECEALQMITCLASTWNKKYLYSLASRNIDWSTLKTVHHIMGRQKRFFCVKSAFSRVSCSYSLTSELFSAPNFDWKRLKTSHFRWEDHVCWLIWLTLSFAGGHIKALCTKKWKLRWTRSAYNHVLKAIHKLENYLSVMDSQVKPSVIVADNEP